MLAQCEWHEGFVRRVSHKADGDQDVQKMISALEGYTFAAPKGQETVRAADHAMLQPMFIAKLVPNGSFRYADLSDGRGTFATLDFDDGTEPPSL